MRTRLKPIAERLPYPLGRIVAKIPYSCRLGIDYRRFRQLLEQSWSSGDTERYVVRQFSRIFEFAKTHHRFYRDFYASAGVMDLRIRNLDDIKHVPTINKTMIRDCLDEFQGAHKLNTGGTTGSPLTFYVDRNAFAREWAHMHHIWAKVGYSYNDLKLTFRGKNLGDHTILYNSVHNEFLVNIYLPPDAYIAELVDVVSKRNIRFVHGYPSAIYNFFAAASFLLSSKQKQNLRSHLEVCLLASEFPPPHVVNFLQSAWGLRCVSWYGQSEMTVLAYDLDCHNSYSCLHTYGYAEVTPEQQLVGTSFHNPDMPLIRYESGDLVSGNWLPNGLLDTFSIKEGRVGDYILDNNGIQIPLTALIFGRHHEIFEYADSVQVSQGPDNIVTVIVTSRTITDPVQALKLFDFSNVEAAFRVEIRRNAIRCKSGKLPLKVPYESID